MTETGEVGRSQDDDVLGITERILGDDLQWYGEIRKRYTDFQVNEIDKDGTVIHLRSRGLPRTNAKNGVAKPAQRSEHTAEPTAEPPAGASEPVGPDPAESQAKLSEEDTKQLVDLVGDEAARQLQELYAACTQKPDKNKPAQPVKIGPIDDRDRRSQIHQTVRRIFQSKIDTTTDGNSTITAVNARSAKGKGKRDPGGGGNNRRNNDRGPRPDGEFLHFTLYAENRGTMDAVSQIARMLRLRPNAIAYAGTKDRRAAIAQRCSVRHQTAEAVARLNANLRGIETGDYDYAARGMHLGQHRGNEFVIVARDCLLFRPAAPGGSVASTLDVLGGRLRTAMEKLHAHGWVNYFGQQRFGTRAVGTHDVGRLILTGDMEGAVKAILSYDESLAAKTDEEVAAATRTAKDDILRSKACKMFLDDNSSGDEALRLLPRVFGGEASVIAHLGRNATSRRDFTGAVSSVARNLRTMYLHAYQSLVWNHAASHRWRVYGNRVVEGDLVLEEAPSSAQDGQQTEDLDEEDDAAVQARPLTAEEAASGRYSLSDVVLPSPGHAVVYPSHATGDFYGQFMSRPENGPLDPNKMHRPQREFSLPGRYRRLIARFLTPPSCEVKAYEGDEEALHPTDLDRLLAEEEEARGNKKRNAPDGEAAPEQADKRVKMADGTDGETRKMDQNAEDRVYIPAATESKGEALETVGETQNTKPHGQKIAAILKFQLGKSAYATVLLRELMGAPQTEDVQAHEQQEGEAMQE